MFAYVYVCACVYVHMTSTCVSVWREHTAAATGGTAAYHMYTTLATHLLHQVLLLRLSPLLPFALSNYLYGMTKVNLLEYLAGTAIGFAPGSLGFVMTGQVGRD